MKKSYLTTLLLFFSSTPFCFAYEDTLNAVHAHLIVGDFHAASERARGGVMAFPQISALHVAYIDSLAQFGDEKEMCEAWTRYLKLFPDEALKNQELQEAMAWGVLYKAHDSPLPLVRLYSLLGAFYSNDAKSIFLMRNYCRDKNSLLRSAAVELSGNMRDAPLADEIFNLLTTESNWRVRKEAIRAIGKMKDKRGYAPLLALLTSDKSNHEEKACAVEALILLFESIKREEVEELAASPRAFLRLLACEVCGHLRSKRDIDICFRLTSDNNSDVRAAALYTLGLLEPVKGDVNFLSLLHSRLKDPCCDVAIIAAWLISKYDEANCRGAFMPLLTHSRREVRLKAASALAASGRYGIHLALELFNSCKSDTFFTMNIAIGLIHQQVAIDAACEALHKGLSLEGGRWMWREDTPFRTLAPSAIRQDDGIASSPEAINQLTRLEILNILAVMQYPEAEKAIRGFLQQYKWGVTGLASALLLMEGDSASLDLVENLLNDKDKRIRLQAALTLSLWGRKEKAITALEEGYEGADRETKERVLEGLGRIGSRSSIPFLLRCLQESQQTLRLIAASALLQCLNH